LARIAHHLKSYATKLEALGRRRIADKASSFIEFDGPDVLREDPQAA